MCRKSRDCPRLFLCPGAAKHSPPLYIHPSVFPHSRSLLRFHCQLTNKSELPTSSGGSRLQVLGCCCVFQRLAHSPHLSSDLHRLRVAQPTPVNLSFVKDYQPPSRGTNTTPPSSSSHRRRHHPSGRHEQRSLNTAILRSAPLPLPQPIM